MKRVVLPVLIGLVLGVSAAAQNANDWPTVGNDPGGMKYSTLTQITPANVSKLTKAWTYDTGARASGYTITPIVINNVMYLPMQGIDHRRAQGRRRHGVVEVRSQDHPGHRARTRRRAAAGSRTGQAPRRRRRASSSRPRTVFWCSSTPKPARRFRAPLVSSTWRPA